MQFDSLDSIRQAGFEGFVSVAGLQAHGYGAIPRARGVYLFIRDTLALPDFVTVGTGGFFKGKDPNVEPPVLQDNWVAGARVVYIGKAGSLRGKATLRSRLSQYMRFGMGKPVGHRGGRYIWQLADSSQLTVCWKATATEEPATVESSLIQMFRERYGKHPFANLRD